MGQTGVCGAYKCPIINSSYVTVGYILCGITVLYIQSAFFPVLVHVYCTSSAYSDRYFFIQSENMFNRNRLSWPFCTVIHFIEYLF
jgi:hypothetical protein